MLSELDVAKRIIVSYLNNNVNGDSLSALFAIQRGDKEELLEHIKALIPIFIEAKKQLEKEIENDRNRTITKG